jgi:hypothetical protein
MRSALGFSRLAALSLVLAAACSGAKGNAEAAIAAADKALAAVPADASKVAPDELKSMTDAMAAARDQMTKGDYAAALGGVKDLPGRAEALAASLPAKSAAMKATLDTLAVAMPRNLMAIKAKLDQLGKSKQLPKGMDAQQVQAAKDTYSAATEAWGGVMSMVQSGDLAGAMGKALEIKTRVTQSLQALGLASDERAWSNVTLPPK